VTNLCAKSLTVLALFSFVGGATSVVRAQVPVATAPPATVMVAKNVSALAFNRATGGQVVARMAKDSGFAVVADSAATNAPVALQSIGGSLDTVLGQLLAVMPPGTVVRAALVPAATKPDGDAIAAFLKAQDAVSRPLMTVPRPAFTPGSFEVLGQRLTLAEAAPLIQSLNLRPVYLVSLPKPPADPIAKMGTLQAETMRQWQSMSPDQRKEAAIQQFQGILNMEPTERQAMLGQMMQQGVAVIQMIKTMTPEQQQSFQQEMMQAMRGSGLIPPTPAK
jgi:hypothetical protein